MGVLKFDLTDVEPGQDFDTPVPKGIYKMRIIDIVDAPSQRDQRPMYTVELEIIEGEWKGRRLWDYIKYEDDSSKWKLSQLLEALKVASEKKRTGSFNPEKYINTIVVVKVKHETDPNYNEGNPQAKVGSMQPLPEGEAEAAADETEEPAEGGEPSGGGDEEEVTAADIRKMDLDELKEFAEEQELEVKFTKRSKAETKANEIIEQLGLADAIEDPEDWDTLSAFDRETLESYIEQEELEIEFDDDTSDEDVAKAVAEEMEIEVPETEDAPAEEADYDSMSVKDLKATCSERGLETKGGKKGMVKRLKEDDAKGAAGDPF